ncbi:phytanoyl-CoA dioxygenase family protein [Microtetraspora sp. NBRC 13810]|uniref:phytanoyl-CoA dioxygenase family protein n=1 Tax=Microtetraspora sp. NBRC 13810 TaxID=3030990 RepID=UPI002557A2B2|nr:phytanoyl-CoA dioxygenase family protein [Microtetraspora sp. NBRC 13810]
MTISTDTPSDLRRRYEQDGYATVPGILSADETEALRAETLRIYKGECGQVEGLLPAAPGDTGDTLLRRYICVHHPHKISSVIRDTLAHPRIVDVLVRLIGPDVKAMQSMLFTKGEGKPGQAWHQDEFFIPTRDRSLTAAWIALDDATVENGCLWVLPGSHAPGIIYPDREHDDERFDCTVESYGFPYADGDAVPVEVAAGTAVFFNGYLLHRSLPNTGRHGLRRALANHYMNARSPLPWQSPPPGVHVGKYDFRDVVIVAGEDPYAYKGYRDIARPHVRRDRDGGCDR